MVNVVAPWMSTVKWLSYDGTRGQLTHAQKHNAHTSHALEDI